MNRDDYYDAEEAAKNEWLDDIDLVGMMGHIESDVLLHELAFGSPEKARQCLLTDIDRKWKLVWRDRQRLAA